MPRLPFCKTIVAAILFAAASLSSAAQAEIVVRVNKSDQRMTVSRDGEVLYRWTVSTGQPRYATPSGSYTAFRLDADHHSKEWDNAPMPHSIFFTKTGVAIHGTFETRGLGAPVSHGCVRLSPAHAATLFAMVKEDGLTNTKVIVAGSEQVALGNRGRLIRQVRQDDSAGVDAQGAADESEDLAPPDGQYTYNQPIFRTPDY